ncbi:unnamed protein product [Spirodela intermedia]|uniref:Xyloglucan endotransglucosylase/hydrolase n=1 Tax=Spirodela intermedia TaxID=51605 RepID=A0A7I8JKD0_SPIIN|nr:unnamed protein product [Spirodela intermedia]CAA6670636.1 unnamed protein product [Spirodela intermedia]
MLVNISLTRSSGSRLIGFKSRADYYYGFFSAGIKLPVNYSAGVVVAFYWVLQTNLYGNGSVGTGREERFHFWFDPAATFHEYSIIWNHRHIRRHGRASRGPMSLYATIWDGSAWATRGGTRPVDYAYAPFVASFAALEMEGCARRALAAFRCSASGSALSMGGTLELSPPQRAAMERARGRFMFYSYCRDGARYSVMPPECGEGKRRLSSRHNK